MAKNLQFVSNARVGLSNIPFQVKLVLVPVWIGLSVIMVVVLAGALTLQSGGVNNKTVLGASTGLSYNLYAAVPKQGNSLTQTVDYTDTRAYKLRAFFTSYGAPYGMIEAIPAFLEAADHYQLPWTLLPAIACKESGCGRIIPYNSNNAFGWAVYTGQSYGAVFSSFADGVWVVAKGLRFDYFDRGFDTVEKIETRYTPPSANSHKGWQKDVTFFMSRLENWEL